jgi:hypothetical protein
MYVSLDNFINEEKLATIDSYLCKSGVLFDKDSFQFRNFKALKKIHGKCINLTNFRMKKWNFEQFRQSLVCPKLWTRNENAEKLKEFVDFIDDLNLFKQIGKMTIILSRPGDKGVEHRDHGLENYVSEFIWLRTNKTKSFYIRGNNNKHFVNNYCIWFDDHRQHNIGEITEDCFSIRIDGIFNDRIREYIYNESIKNDIFLKKDYSNLLKNKSYPLFLTNALMNKCNSENCSFIQHPNINNNNGTHCCIRCKNNNGHGEFCKKIHYDTNIYLYGTQIQGISLI